MKYLIALSSLALMVAISPFIGLFATVAVVVIAVEAAWKHCSG